MDTNVFMEDLTAYGNISYTPPETFSKNSDPPGTSFDVYRSHTNMYFWSNFDYLNQYLHDLGVS